MTSRRVLVTGAGGFVGSHLVEKLLARGDSVRAFVRYNSRGDWGMLEELSSEQRREIEVVTGDVRDGDAVRKTAEGVEIIFHLAALVGIPYSYVHPREVVESNVIGTLNVMTAAMEAGVGRVVHTSTSEVYGTAESVPMSEEHRLHPQSPYAATKVGADMLASSYHRSFGLPVVTARPFNVYGPRQSARAVIPTIAVQALSADRVEIGSPTPTRDLTFVADTAAGLMRLAEAEGEGLLGEVIHIGSGFEVSVGELAEKIVALSGREVAVVSVPERVRPAASEVERLFCDASRAHKLMGWRPTVSLDEGLGCTVEWIKDHLDRYKAELYAV
jgi:dTDP-glucose 4,6-dehydratase